MDCEKYRTFLAPLWLPPRRGPTPPDRGKACGRTMRAPTDAGRRRAGLGPAPTKSLQRFRVCRRGRTPAGPGLSAPGALVRQTQARKEKRNHSNFCKPRAQWPGWNWGKSLRFCAPEGLCHPKGITPVMGGRGKGEYGHIVPILSRPPAILWFLSHRWERNPPRRAEPSVKKKTPGHIPRPVHIG